MFMKQVFLCFTQNFSKNIKIGYNKIGKEEKEWRWNRDRDSGKLEKPGTKINIITHDRNETKRQSTWKPKQPHENSKN